MKICTKCGIEKDLNEFHKKLKGRDGYRSICKTCRKLYVKKHQNERRKYKKEYRLKNIDHIKEYDRIYKKEYYKKNKDHLTEYKKNYYKKNIVKIHEKAKIYYQKNKEKIYDHILKRKEYDYNFKLTTILRGRILSAIKNQYGTKGYSSMELLGCTIEKVRKHLESQFTEGMTWDNHGNYGWHIDHIRPCSSFDLTDPEQQKQCFHYTNLQPLWAEDNLIKSDKWKGINNET